MLAGKSLVRRIEALPTGENDKPVSPVVITSCGALSSSDPLPSANPNAVEGDKYEEYPADEENLKEEDVARHLEIAKALKDIGTREFKAGNPTGAYSVWEKGLRYLDVHPFRPDDVEEKDFQEYEATRYSLLSNASLAALKITPPNARAAISNTSRILNMKPGTHSLTDADRSKALYRRGLAQVIVKDDDAAEKDFQLALKLSPGDAGIKAELTKVAKRREDLVKKQKAAFSKMFA